MKKSHKEKYLGDIISDKGDHKDNIDERVNKGYVIVNEIKAILKEIPLGQYKLDIGLKLRQAMFISAI